MSDIITIETDDPTRLAKRALFLAYKAAGGPAGMGVFQARDGMTEEDVWNNVITAGDYPGPANLMRRGSNHIRADYVFGRMLKLNLEFVAEGIQVSTHSCRVDYQAWCNTYPTYQLLIKAAVKDLIKETQPVQKGEIQ